MKSSLVAFFFIYSLGLGKSESSSQQYVYICSGPKSIAYHRSSRCKGLSRCSSIISKVSLAEAKNLNRRSCRIEYR